ncbi:MAG: tetratricopeptide repeat protein [Steroidobacteraceae bacterium]
MPMIIFSLIIQVALIVHCVRSGRAQMWIWIILFVPLVGSIAYVAVELLPDLMHGRTARTAARKLRRTLDPGRDLREKAALVRQSGNVSSRSEYARELLRSGDAKQAIVVLRETLTGIYENDPDLMLQLAEAEHTAGDAAAARSTLENLIRNNPEFKSPDGHLLYARALEDSGDTGKAVEEYAVLASYYPGAEARVRYARLLKSTGNDIEARKVLRELMDHAALAPAHYRRAQREWLAQAKQELSG